MKKFFVMTVVAGLVSLGLPASGNAAYIFGDSPSGSQTLTLNGTTVIQASQTGWFDGHGEHLGGNSNYFAATEDEGGHRNFFGFDLSNFSEIITSAVLNVGNDPLLGISGGPLAWALYDVDGPINSAQNYEDIGIWSDLGTGISYGSASITGPTSNVSLSLNSEGINAINRAAGRSFFVGGAVTDISGAVPEPATWLMMILGFATIGSIMRRRSNGLMPLTTQ